MWYGGGSFNPHPWFNNTLFWEIEFTPSNLDVIISYYFAATVYVLSAIGWLALKHLHRRRRIA